MQFFIGITPPEEIQEKIISFQRSFVNNGLPNCVEPHVTVKSQGGLTDDRAWLSRVEEAAKNIKPFQISFEGAGSFGEDVIFLKPAEPQEIVALHKALFNAVVPFEDPTNKYFENDRYYPHMTLGGLKWGFNKKAAYEMKEKAQQEFGNLPAFEINSIRIYQENTENKWNKMLDIPLGE